MSVWADIHRRANGVQERKEDKGFKNKTFEKYADRWSDWISNYPEPVKEWAYSRYSEDWKEGEAYRKYRDMLIKPNKW